VFVGNTATVTTTVSQRLTGAAEVPLYSAASASGQHFDLASATSRAREHDLQFRWHQLLDRRRVSRKTVVRGVGVRGVRRRTWNVGFCVRNENSNSMASDW